MRVVLFAFLGLICHHSLLAEDPLTAEEWQRFKKTFRPRQSAHDTTNRYSGKTAAILFGKLLFFEKGLTEAQISCSACHIPDQKFTDSREVAIGVASSHRNTPTLLGVGSEEWFSRDGRSDTLWNQSLRVLQDEKEMGGNRKYVVQFVLDNHLLNAAYSEAQSELPRVIATSDKVEQEKRVFADIGKCLAAYVETLGKTRTRFDDFLASFHTRDEATPASLNATELKGLRLFVGKGRCVLCHQGENLSDGIFHNLGLPPKLNETSIDTGRYGAVAELRQDEYNAAGRFSDDREYGRRKLTSIVNDESQWAAFKTPTLRNVGQTAPYMHDGRFRDLRDVVKFYSTLEGQVAGHHKDGVLTPLNFSEDETSAVVAFLEALGD